jgi:hypothetical protein
MLPGGVVGENDEHWQELKIEMTSVGCELVDYTQKFETETLEESAFQRRSLCRERMK